MTLTLLTLVAAALHPQQAVSSAVTAQKIQIIKGKKGHQQPSTQTAAVPPASSETAAKNDARPVAKEQVVDEKQQKGDEKKKHQAEQLERIGNSTQREFNNAANALAGEE